MIELRARYIGGMGEPVSVRIYGMTCEMDGTGWFLYRPIDSTGIMRCEELSEFDGVHRFVSGRVKKVDVPDEVLP
jgi:hypothetical protein